MGRVPNARIRELCGVRKGVDEKIDKSVLLAISKELRMIGLLEGCMWESVWAAAL